MIRFGQKMRLPVPRVTDPEKVVEAVLETDDLPGLMRDVDDHVRQVGDVRYEITTTPVIIFYNEETDRIVSIKELGTFIEELNYWLKQSLEHEELAEEDQMAPYWRRRREKALKILEKYGEPYA